jgi:hypothetical protein
MSRDEAGAVPALVAARAGQLAALNLLLAKIPGAAKSLDKVRDGEGLLATCEAREIFGRPSGQEKTSYNFECL